MRSLAELMDEAILEADILTALAEQSQSDGVADDTQPGKNNGIYPANSQFKPNSDDWVAAAAWNRRA